MKKLIPLFFILIISCNQSDKKIESLVSDSVKSENKSVYKFQFQYLWLEKNRYQPTDAILSRFKTPDNFSRLTNREGSYGEWLNGFPLRPEGTNVHLYNGELKGYQGAHAAVLNIDIGNENLQSGANAIIRLRAEYLFATKQYEKIVFYSTDSIAINYLQYLKGKRIVKKQNRICINEYGKHYDDPSDHQVLLLYLEDVFRFADLSIKSLYTRIISPDSIAIGDIFIHKGNPGHAIMVMDVAVNNKTGEKIFMLVQSYRPAQEIHILKNDYNKNMSPWYPVHAKSKLITPEYVFDWSELRRFVNL